jgi:hypothetical protein
MRSIGNRIRTSSSLSYQTRAERGENHRMRNLSSLPEREAALAWGHGYGDGRTCRQGTGTSSSQTMSKELDTQSTWGLLLCPHLLVHPVDTCVTARQCSSVSEATGVALYTETLCLYSFSFLFRLTIGSYYRVRHLADFVPYITCMFCIDSS